MGIEIERKFLLCNDNWRNQVSRSLRMSQGYLQRDEHSAIRIRLCDGQGRISV